MAFLYEDSPLKSHVLWSCLMQNKEIIGTGKAIWGSKRVRGDLGTAV